MKILIVEDDPHKSRELMLFVSNVLTVSNIVERQSFQSGLKQAINDSPDLILLDMTMPTFDVSLTDKGGRTRTYAGRDILVELRRRHLTSKVIIVTQFESFGEGHEKKTLNELKAELRSDFPTNYIATVYYHPAATNWKRELEELIVNLEIIS